jgi:hypothetical protein
MDHANRRRVKAKAKHQLVKPLETGIAHGEESFMTDQIQPVLQGAESDRALLDATDAVMFLLDHQAGLFQ